MESKTKKVTKPSVFAQKSSTISAREVDSKRKHLKIAQRFILKRCIGEGTFFKFYRAIDMTSRKFVTIYIKPFSKEKVFSKNIKEELKQKIFPPVIWSDTYKIDKNTFDIEVHAKFGPSLEEISQIYKKKISQGTFFLLAYHLLKLADRLDNAGFVCRNLSQKSFVFSENYLKNQVYFLNSFDIEKKNEENLIAYNPKYCSIGTHLKLKSSSKDTIESICYILIDFYLQGKLFHNSENLSEKDFLELKSLYKPERIPKLFANFFCYVKSLNHNDDIKFTQWKRNFKRQVQDIDDKPYEWIKAKSSLLTNSKNQKLSAAKEGFLAAFGISNSKNESSQCNQSYQSDIKSLENEVDSGNDLDMEENVNEDEKDPLDFDLSIEQIQEREEHQEIRRKIEQFQMDRLLESNNFFKSRRLCQ